MAKTGLNSKNSPSSRVTTDLRTAYRPTSFAEVIGHARVCRSLEEVLRQRSSHAFLFHGPSGVGKTTLARLIARTLGCRPNDLIEIDAATHTGIDAMRDVAGSLLYAPLAGEVKVVIVDEAHGLSRQSWDSLLKIVEDPPKHLFWCFCTTAPAKVPATIRSRCVVYELKPLRPGDLAAIIASVATRAKLELPDDVVGAIAERSEGSARNALSILAQASHCKTRKEVLRLANQVERDDDSIAPLCRLLIGRGPLTWAAAMQVTKPLLEQNPESVRIAVVAYLTAVLKNTSKDGFAAHLLELIDAFAEPYPATPLPYPLLLSIGRVVFSGES